MYAPGLSGDLSSIGSVVAGTETGGTAFVFVGDASGDFGVLSGSTADSSTGVVAAGGAVAWLSSAVADVGGAFVQKLGTNSMAFTFNVENFVETSESPSCCDIISVSSKFSV